MTRSERQKECVRNWINSKCRATIVASTGFGKTRTAFLAIFTLLKQKPEYQVIVIVPTTTLKEQWIKQIDDQGLSLNVRVYVINSAIKQPLECDLLVIDEVHRIPSDSFENIFHSCKYKFILGLTATYERLDGKEYILDKYCPKCDEVALTECILNGWVSKYREYVVLITVDDIETYLAYNKDFISHFEYFGFNWELAMKMVGPDGFRTRIQYRDLLCQQSPKLNKTQVLKDITYHATGFMRAIQQRKTFINNHPRKIEIAKKILEARKHKKCIVFSGNTKMAESLGIENVYTGKTSKKRSKTMIEDFNAGKFNTLSTIKRANEGLDVKGLEVGIVIGTDSSKTSAKQRLGRVIRAEQYDKNAEFFTIVIQGTVEEKWLSKSREGDDYTVIDEDGLERVLNGQKPDAAKLHLQNYMFRF